MTKEQADAIARSLRESAFDSGGDVLEQRVQFARLMESRPPPTGVSTSKVSLGGSPAIRVSPAVEAADAAILYFHGGGYVIGTAEQTIRLPAEIVRRTGITAFSVDYRLAPEHPFPAAVDDGLAAYEALLATHEPRHLAVAGESAGGGLALATLLAAKQRDLPMPVAAVVMSPWVDLTLSGHTMGAKAASDPVVTAPALARRATEYAGGEPCTNPLLSPLWGDFTGFPPMLIQVGSNEILLDDAVRLARCAAAADVSTLLEVTAHVHHVFQGLAAQLSEGEAALQRSSRFLSELLIGATG